MADVGSAMFPRTKKKVFEYNEKDLVYAEGVLEYIEVLLLMGHNFKVDIHNEYTDDQSSIVNRMMQRIWY